LSIKESQEYYQLVLNISYVLFCDVIINCTWMELNGKVGVYNKIVITNLKREKIEIKEIYI